MESKLSRWCDGLLEAGWLVALITTPLFFNIHSDRVFEPDKLTLLRSIALIMAVVWLVKLVDLQWWRQKGELSWRHAESVWKKPFILPIALLALVYIVSTIFSVTPSVSWAGSYQRLQGTYTTLSYLLIFTVAITTMRTQAQINRVATAVIVASIPVAFYGLLQHFNLDPLPWGGDVQRRVAGHMGNAIFIAAYLIMAVPLTLARIIAAFNNILNDDELATADVIRSSIYIFTLAIQLITIYWSGSRGPWLGLAVGMFAFVLIVLVSLRNAASDKSRFGLKDGLSAMLLVIVGTAVAYGVASLLIGLLAGSGRFASLSGAMGSFVAFVIAIGLVVLSIFVMLAAQRGWRWLWLSWMTLSLLLGSWLILFNLPDASQRYANTPVIGSVFATLDEWRDLPLVGRLGTILESDSGTGRVRVLIWEGALELLLPHEPVQFPNGERDTFNFLRPLIGYGPESMYVAYNRFYPPELATIEARNASPDRSHNETFDALVITGLAGFIVWQWLYLSVFYYGFKWLGVLRSKFDRNLLIALWVGVGLLVTAVFVAWRGPIYFGVALPFGSILGLVLYLVYYALFARLPDEETRPFRWDHLLVTALIAAILAHYVEIHFGIAIAATRTHFFVYVALLFVVTHLLPTFATEGSSATELVDKVRRRATAVGQTSYGVWGPILLNSFMLALVLGTMGYTYITYNQPPDVNSVDQITAGAIFHQSFLLDARKDFVESPFIFLMFTLTWALGTLVMASEMAKDGDLRFTTAVKKLSAQWQKITAITFAAMGVGSFLYRLLFPLPDSAGSTSLLGQSLFWIWGAMSIWSAIRLWREPENGRLTATAVALAGLTFAIPLTIAGGGLGGVLIGLVCVALLALLWDSSWSNSLGAVAVLAIVSFGFGLIYTYFQAFLLRFAILYQNFNPAPDSPDLLKQFLVEEASQTASMLTFYYVLVFVLMTLSAFALSLSRKPVLRQNGSPQAYGALAGLLLLGIFLVYSSNLQVIQADVIYKRGKFYDTQAARNSSPEMWEYAIAVYEAAIDRVPREDFYYLFLGRAYLELATMITETDPVETAVLLQEAQDGLLKAQDLNPLNTDHTANLARLNTRWISLNQAEADQKQQAAETYYLDALALSPQNSVIRNEYASLLVNIKEDCQAGLDTYQESLRIDPYYEETYFRLADSLVLCGDRSGDEAERDSQYEQALTVLNEGLAINGRNPRAWLRLGQLYQQMSRYDEAVTAYDTAVQQDTAGSTAPAWNVDMIIANMLMQKGDLAEAEIRAQQALQAAPAEAHGQIQQLLGQITGQDPESIAPPDSTPTPELETVTDFDLDGPRPLAAIPTADRNDYYNAYPPYVLNEGSSYQALIVTEKGEMRLQLYHDRAPLTVNSFVYLASQGFFDDLTFHRVLEGFMAQGGDPLGNGRGGPGYEFDNETHSDLLFDRPGLLAMANAGLDTNGSQFFITFVPTPQLNGGYTIFGELIEGETVLNSLTFRDPNANPSFTGDRIERIEIIEVTP